MKAKTIAIATTLLFALVLTLVTPVTHAQETEGSIMLLSPYLFKSNPQLTFKTLVFVYLEDATAIGDAIIIIKDDKGNTIYTTNPKENRNYPSFYTGKIYKAKIESPR